MELWMKGIYSIYRSTNGNLKGWAIHPEYGHIKLLWAPDDIPLQEYVNKILKIKAGLDYR